MHAFARMKSNLQTHRARLNSMRSLIACTDPHSSSTPTQISTDRFELHRMMKGVLQCSECNGAAKRGHVCREFGSASRFKHTVLFSGKCLLMAMLTSAAGPLWADEGDTLSGNVGYRLQRDSTCSGFPIINGQS